MDSNGYWQRLRWLRANPPDLARTNRDRRETFTSALEQAEQLVRSAELLGPESRPINLFYGLSQGARAVAAARMSTPDFRLRSHGIEHVGSLNRSIGNIAVQSTDSGAGSFTAMAELLRSPGLPEPVQLKDLLAALPLRTPAASWTDRPRAVIVQHGDQNSGMALVLTPKILARTQGWAPMPELHSVGLSEKRAQISCYIEEHYPGLAGMAPLPDGDTQLCMGETDMQFTLELTADTSIGGDGLRRQLIDARTVEMMGGRFALPRFGSAEESCHPTVAMWACLWTFSMLARYEPVRWAKTINVDRSGDATALEEILEDALTFIPWSLLDALDQTFDRTGKN